GLTQVLNQSVGANALTVSVNTSAALQLPTGTATGTITLSNPSNQFDTTTITVYLGVSLGTLGNLTLSQTSATFNATVNGGPQQLAINLSATNAAFTNYSISGINPSGSWLSAVANNTTLPGSITLTVNPSGLSATTYTGSVNVTF